MHTIKRIVISGGPATGKTSILNELSTLGYTCFPEISREIIQEEIDRKSRVLPWDDLPAFSKRVIEGRIEQFKRAKTLSFFDRSIIDSLAYMRKDQWPIPEEWDEYARTYKYHTSVFITPPWKDIFVNDHERRESWEQLLHIHEYLVSSYKAYGYDVIEVPKSSLEKRIAFILGLV